MEEASTTTYDFLSADDAKRAYIPTLPIDSLIDSAFIARFNADMTHMGKVEVRCDFDDGICNGVHVCGTKFLHHEFQQLMDRLEPKGYGLNAECIYIDDGQPSAELPLD